MNTVQSAWSKYRSQVIISDRDKTHIKDIEMGFYAGSAVMLSAIVELLDSSMSAQAKAAMLSGLQEEIALYALETARYALETLRQ